MRIPPLNLELMFGNEKIERIADNLPTKTFKFLGHVIDEHLTWAGHTSSIHSKISSGNFALARIKNTLPMKIRLSIYNSLVRPYLEYGIVAWGGIRNSKLKPLILAQKKAIRNVAGLSSRAHSDPLFASLNILKLCDLFRYNCALFMHKFRNGLQPNSFANMFQPLGEPNRTCSYRLARVKYSFLEEFPMVCFPRVWNNLNLHLKTTQSYSSFKRILLNAMLSAY